MPNADGRRELPRRRNSGSPNAENSENVNFIELRKGDVRRISLPRTPVNKWAFRWITLNPLPLSEVNPRGERERRSGVSEA